MKYTFLSTLTLSVALLSSRQAQAAVDFFTNPGGAVGCNCAFRTAAGNPDRVNFDGYSDGVFLSNFVSDGVGVNLALLNATGNIVATNCEIFHPPVWGYPGVDPQVVDGGVLGSYVSGTVVANKMQFVFSEPVEVFGLWIFDDGEAEENVFRIRVTETNGVSTASPILDSANGFSHAVEGFIGVVSSLGISTVVVESTRPDGSLGIAPFEVDNVQLLRRRSPLPSVVRYVNINNASPSSPYTSWETAATVIQDAIDVALPCDEIVVADGVYETGGRTVHGTLANRVAVTKPLTVRSVNGPDMTVIRGYQVPGVTNGPGAVRCVYLQEGASLIGFTVEAGATLNGFDDSDDLLTRRVVSGGGVWCESDSVKVSNCVIKGNSAVFGGGVCQGTLLNCTLSNNVAQRTGGGSLLTTLIGCNLISNSASVGGGARMGTLSECMLLGNSAVYGGGAQDANLSHCELRDNVAAEQGGGARGGSLDNCLVVKNTAADGGGACGSTVVHCTVVANTAFYGGGISGTNNWGALPGCDMIYISPWGFTDCVSSSAHISNSVIYYNNAPDAPNVTADGNNGFIFFPGDWNFIQFSCTFPLSVVAAGNITGAPQFVDAAAGDFRLQANSPCINAGLNASAPAGPDLDGNPRIVGGRVDIGAYEFQSVLPLSYASWATGFGLSGAAAGAGADADGDRLPNSVEYILGSNPSASGASGSPAVTLSGGSMLFTFSRDDASESPGVVLAVETSADLLTWPAVLNVGPDTAASTPGVSITENGSAPDTISITIPPGTGPRRFARLKVTIAP